jgi:hypothetical protein
MPALDADPLYPRRPSRGTSGFLGSSQKGQEPQAGKHLSNEQDGLALWDDSLEVCGAA